MLNIWNFFNNVVIKISAPTWCTLEQEVCIFLYFLIILIFLFLVLCNLLKQEVQRAARAQQSAHFRYKLRESFSLTRVKRRDYAQTLRQKIELKQLILQVYVSNKLYLIRNPTLYLVIFPAKLSVKKNYYLGIPHSWCITVATTILMADVCSDSFTQSVLL